MATYTRVSGPKHRTDLNHHHRDEIIEAAARAFYVSNWADDQEERGWPAGSPSGMELTEMAPKTPRTVLAFAKRYIRAVEQANGGVAADQLYEQARAAALAPGGMRYARRKPSPDLFGHYLAMGAMGSGVAWTDDYPETGIKNVRAEWYGRDGSIGGISPYEL